MYGRRQKKFPFTVRTTGRVIPFRSRLISVRLPFLSVFKPFPFCPTGSPSVPVNGPFGVIKHAQSLIAQEGSRQFSDRDRARASLPSTVIEQQNGSRQFSDRDRARARTT